MDILTEAEIGFTIYMSENETALRKFCQLYKIPWEPFVEVLRCTHSGGMGYGMISVAHRIEMMDEKREI